MNQKNLLRIKIEKYLKIPLLLAIFWLVAAGIMFVISREAGFTMLFFDVIYMVIVLVIYYQKRPDIMAEMVSFSFEQSQIQKELLKDLALPYTLIDLEGRFLWSNQQFYEVIGKEKMRKKSLFHVFSEITREILPIHTGQSSVEIEYENRNYRLEMKCIHARWGSEDDFVDASNSLIAVYLFDETEIKKYIRENQEQKMVACLIYIDNYEEALESIDEVKESLLTALINRKLTKYMQNAGAIIKKLEKDKYLAVFQKKNLTQLQNDKFSILDEIRSINVGNSIAVTLSISVGAGMDGYLETYEAARSGMDLALGRGGDQAVVKDGEKILYYGGKTQGVEKGTRVKARVKARALKELLEGKDRVIIMGHKIPDMDAIGSAIGIYRIAENLNKKAHIVLNTPTLAIRSVINNFIGNSNYEEDMFVKSEEAMELMDANTLLVVVDVNRPSYTECEDLLGKAKSIVVIDHHRQTNEVIENPVLTYIEPNASSACEMVAEILQYMSEKTKMKPYEADAMYAGMLVDTDNFVTKTGVRTFEAAAFLRRCGADVIRVRKMFRFDMESYKIRAKAVERAETYLGSFALSVMPDMTGIESPTVMGAQVANELLDIDGVHASFVLTKVEETIYISARSIDEINVQIIMEKLGGGGHANVAGAQMKGISEKEALEKMKEVLKTMKIEGEI
ncbi:MAG: DHH family phosphoesterase [Lachnospiraceae bacterium]|nr:DHH family phosphoesterase [Lachnospiraceae bacterium]